MYGQRIRYGQENLGDNFFSDCPCWDLSFNCYYFFVMVIHVGSAMWEFNSDNNQNGTSNTLKMIETVQELDRNNETKN